MGYTFLRIDRFHPYVSCTGTLCITAYQNGSSEPPRVYKVIGLSEKDWICLMIK